MCASKWNSHLPPNPPPRWGTTIRTRLSGISRVSVTPLRAGNGVWVVLQTVTFSPSHWAMTAWGSIGTGWVMSATYRPSTITSASAKPASRSPRTIRT